MGVALLGAAGGWVLASGHPVGAGFRGDVHLAFGIDGLSGFFFIELGLVFDLVVTVSVAAASPQRFTSSSAAATAL